MASLGELADFGLGRTETKGPEPEAKAAAQQAAADSSSRERTASLKKSL